MTELLGVSSPIARGVLGLFVVVHAVLAFAAPEQGRIAGLAAITITWAGVHGLGAGEGVSQVVPAPAPARNSIGAIVGAGN